MMKKKDNIIIITLFAVILLTLSIGSLIAKDREFSPNENRNLSQPSELSFDRVIDGRFEEDAEKYVSDQILARDSWIEVKSVIKRLIGNKDINGVYLAEDGYYIEKTDEYEVDSEIYENNLKSIKSFFDDISSYIPAEKLSVMLVPTAQNILKDKLPKGVTTYDENGRLDEACSVIEGDKLGGYNFIDLRDALTQAASNNLQLYYRTDHHWTASGAFLGYGKLHEELDPKLGTSPREFEYVDASDRFLGTLYSKVLLPDTAYDTVQVIGDAGKGNSNSKASAKETAKAMNGRYTVTADGKTLPGIYDMSKLKEKDKYAVFLGGNYGKAEITGGPKNGRNLLLIKDSFANSLVPMLCGEYESITMIDLRYFSGNLREYMKAQKVNEVLVLYSMSNIITDKNLKMLDSTGVVLQ
ncbi:MAG TPA: DHHW family protein [Anaerovoracaceae bacterium]|nr:DHHW family protein [Anaerovoracaceae bacterium]